MRYKESARNVFVMMRPTHYLHKSKNGCPRPCKSDI